MRLTFLGTGSPLPSPNRLQTSFLVERGNHTLLVDCGSGTTHRLAQTGTAHTAVDAIVFTHLHLDHIADLSTLLKARWLDGTPELTVYGPPGTAAVCERLVAVDNLAERADLTVTELDPAPGSFELGPHQITYVETAHSARCFAYRFGDKLTISGDTAPTVDVFGLADGSDVLVHECSFPDGTATEGHTTPTELGNSLGAITVEAVYLTHLFPETEPHAAELESTVENYTSAVVSVPDDLDSVDISCI